MDITKIKVGYAEYDVQFVECVNKYTPRKGEIDFFSRTIKIDRDMSTADKKETVIHEIVHGLEEFMGFDLEEQIVKKLGHGLATVFKDNPQLLECLK